MEWSGGESCLAPALPRSYRLCSTSHEGENLSVSLECGFMNTPTPTGAGATPGHLRRDAAFIPTDEALRKVHGEADNLARYAPSIRFAAFLQLFLPSASCGAMGWSSSRILLTAQKIGHSVCQPGKTLTISSILSIRGETAEEPYTKAMHQTMRLRHRSFI